MTYQNLQRVVLSPELADAIAQTTDPNEAFALLQAADEAPREITLAEALVAIGKVSRAVEALGREEGEHEPKPGE